jgi:hypothetical protein
MGIGAEASDIDIAQASAHAGHDPNGQAFGHKNGALFDVNFYEGKDFVGRKVWFAPTQGLHVATRFGHVLGKRPVRVRARHLQRLGGKLAERRMRTDVVAVEPGRLFRPDSHHRDVAPGHDALRPEAGDRGKSRHHPRGPVEIASLRHRVHVRTGHEPGQGPIPPRHGHVEIQRAVGGDLEPEFGCDAGGEAMGEILAVAIGGPDDSAADTGFRRQVVKERLREAKVGLHH